MVGAVIHDVLHGLPEWIAVDTEFQGFVFERAVEIGLRQAANESQEARLEFTPALAESVGVGILRGVRESRWRTALEAFEPDPFCAEDVGERVAHGRKAGAHRLGELSGR